MREPNLLTWLTRITARLTLGKDSEDRLVVAAQRRDRSAFDALRRVHEPSLRGFLAQRIDPGNVDDVLQETWLTCWSKLPQFQRRSRFKAWLYGIALHKCREQYRAQARTAREGDSAMIGDVLAPGRLADDFELRETVKELLTPLPDVQREVLELYYFAELSLPEIAEALPRNLNTVKYQFYQAHERVAQGLNRLNSTLAQFDGPCVKEGRR